MQHAHGLRLDPLTRALAIAFALLAAGVSARAHADAIMPPPENCPRGAAGASGHGGPYCAPTVCATAADCERYGQWARRLRPDLPPAQYACAPAGLCLERRTVQGGWGGRPEIEIVLASCATDADCPAGVACTMADRCIADGSSEGPVPPELLPARVDPLPSASSATGCAGAGAILALVLGVLTVSSLALASAHARRRADRHAAVRALLESRGRATHAELAALCPDVARALAPFADRVRVEADDEEPIYVLEDADGASASARRS